MQEIPLLRVRYAKRFARTLVDRGYDANEWLRRAGVDPTALDTEDAWMPVSQLCRFLEIAVAASGYKTLGLDTGIAPRQQHSTFSKLVLYSPTLFQSLSSVCKSVAMEDISARFRLVRDGALGWMNCGAVAASEEAVRQIETYRYAAILEVIRCAAGPAWKPAFLRLQSDADAGIAGADLLQGVEVQFGAAGLVFSIEPALFSRPMFDIPDVPAEKPRFDSPPVELPAVLREVVRTQVLAQRNTIAATAAALGIAPRTLQRHLAENDLSFTRLLEYIRIDTAKERLAENTESIAAIANQLGYKHSTHFSRAFRRVCGVTPREYRKLSG